MDIIRLTTRDQWLAGTFARCLLDVTQYVSLYGHPAIVPTVDITHDWEMSGAQALASEPVVTYRNITPGDSLYAVPAIEASLSSAWIQFLDLMALTTQNGDALSFVTDAQEVQIRLLGYTAAGQGFVSGEDLHSAAVRNGALVDVLVSDADGVDQIVEVVDTYQRNPLVTVYLFDGDAHRITVRHSGQYSVALRPISVPSQGESPGPSVLAALSAAPDPAAGSLVRGTWRILATDPDPDSHLATYSLLFTPPEGTESLEQSGLQAGIHYDWVPGVDLFVATDAALDSGDSAVFTTDVIQMGVQSIDCGWGDARGPAAYTTSVLDSGDAQTQWFVAEWMQNEPWAQAVVTTGNLDDAGEIRWHTPYAQTPQTLDLPLDTALPGTQMGLAGLAAAPRGQYAQVALHVIPYATQIPYLRDLTLYHWVPESDRVMVTKMPLGERITLGPVLCALVGTLETFLATTYVNAGRFGRGGALVGATDEYLLAYGGDLGMPPYQAESPETYRQRLLAALGSAQEGGTLPYIARQIAQLIFLEVQDPVLTNSGPHDEAICAEASGARAVHVIRDPAFPPQSYWITLPPLPYPAFPSGSITVTQIEAIITAFVRRCLNPVASMIDVHNISLQIYFPWH